MSYNQKAQIIADQINRSKYRISRDDMPHQDFFGDRVYVRTLFVPRGTAIIGKIHKTKHVFALISGEMIFTDGVNRKTEVGPKFFESEVGVQRTIIAVTDCLLMNAHACSKDSNSDTIEDELTTMDIALMGDKKQGLLT